MAQGAITQQWLADTFGVSVQTIGDDLRFQGIETSKGKGTKGGRPTGSGREAEAKDRQREQLDRGRDLANGKIETGVGPRTHTSDDQPPTTPHRARDDVGEMKGSLSTMVDIDPRSLGPIGPGDQLSAPACAGKTGKAIFVRHAAHAPPPTRGALFPTCEFLTTSTTRPPACPAIRDGTDPSTLRRRDGAKGGRAVVRMAGAGSQASGTSGHG